LEGKYVRIFFLRLAKTLFFKSPLARVFLPVMKFDMSVAQLNFITESIRNLDCDGSVMEVGVGGGATSVIVNLDMKWHAKKREFFAVDTFAGFTKEDIKFEQENRGKEDNYLYYRSNSREWYTKTLRAHGIRDAHVFKQDAKTFDYSIARPIAFCLFDVDLYKPTQEVLPKLYENLAAGGVIVVDDCSPALSIYDGAGQAYREFCDAMGLPQEVVFEKLGVIRKPAA
jgi:hypothetical protein